MNNSDTSTGLTGKILNSISAAGFEISALQMVTLYSFFTHGKALKRWCHTLFWDFLNSTHDVVCSCNHILFFFTCVANMSTLSIHTNPIWPHIAAPQSQAVTSCHPFVLPHEMCVLGSRAKSINRDLSLKPHTEGYSFMGREYVHVSCSCTVFV